uniref:VQ domain-containing protein n=1 Tax=Opuntia streptacantha TaxID=393608 RepID=A0A7C9DNK8_OPUST
MASTSEWLHFHQTNPSAAAPPHSATASPTDLFWTGQLSEATVVSTTVISATATANPGQSPAQQLGPEGRVTKPARRRTRASRRTPTTLLNTDTTNFRAMVQQFTGGPSTAFGFSPGAATQTAQGRWNQALGGPGSGFELQFPYGDHSVRRSDLVPEGTGRVGGGDVFGNINVGIFPAAGTGTGGRSSSSENRGSSNNDGSGGGFQF